MRPAHEPLSRGPVVVKGSVLYRVGPDGGLERQALTYEQDRSKIGQRAA